MEGEMWKPIKGYEGYYAISNKGNIVSLMFRNNQVCKPRIKHLSPTDNGNGYLIIGLKVDGNRKNFYIHRLVAEHFLEKKDGCEYVNHIDYNTKNNDVSNLEWCTQKDNVNHSIAHLHQRKCAETNTGEKHIHYRRGRYCVRVARKTLKVDKEFATLEEAVAFRNEVVG